MKRFNKINFSIKNKFLIEKYIKKMGRQEYLNDVKITLMKFDSLEDQCKTRGADPSDRFLKNKTNFDII